MMGSKGHALSRICELRGTPNAHAHSIRTMPAARAL
jgi:hypothetical protein